MPLENPFYTAEMQGAYELRSIGQDMFFPPRDCEPEQQLTPNSELRMLHSVAGHFGLFGFEQSCLAEVDQHLVDLLAVER